MLLAFDDDDDNDDLDDDYDDGKLYSTKDEEEPNNLQSVCGVPVARGFGINNDVRRGDREQSANTMGVETVAPNHMTKLVLSFGDIEDSLRPSDDTNIFLIRALFNELEEIAAVLY